MDCPPPGGLPDSGIKSTSPVSPALASGFFTTGATWLKAMDCPPELRCYGVVRCKVVGRRGFRGQYVPLLKGRLLLGSTGLLPDSNVGSVLPDNLHFQKEARNQDFCVKCAFKSDLRIKTWCN